MRSIVFFSTVGEGSIWQDALVAKTGQRTVPSVFVRGRHIGGCDDTIKAHNQKKLLPLITGDGAGEPESLYDYDFIVIGGGSGGLASSKVRLLVFRCHVFVLTMKSLQHTTYCYDCHRLLGKSEPGLRFAIMFNQPQLGQVGALGVLVSM